MTNYLMPIRLGEARATAMCRTRYFSGGKRKKEKKILDSISSLPAPVGAMTSNSFSFCLLDPRRDDRQL